MMKESLEKSKEELKRADHLIYVSLKYTRTCDIFKSVLERLINAIEYMLDAILKNMENEKIIEDIPAQPVAKSKIVKQNTDDESIREMTDLYLRMRKINKAPFDRQREFRRHVTMTVNLEGENFDVNIDNITDYYKTVKDYYEIVEGKMGGGE